MSFFPGRGRQLGTVATVKRGTFTSSDSGENETYLSGPDLRNADQNDGLFGGKINVGFVERVQVLQKTIICELESAARSLRACKSVRFTAADNPQRPPSLAQALGKDAHCCDPQSLTNRRRVVLER